MEATIPTILPLIFKAYGAVQGAAAMLGLIESLDKKLDKLLASDFNAGVRCLNEISSATKEHDFLLKQGWNRFHSALANEEGERKALAYISLAFCQFHSHEPKLAVNTLIELQEYEYKDMSQRIKIILVGLGFFATPFMTPMMFISITELLKELIMASSETKILALQRSAKEIIDDIKKNI